MVKLKLSLEYCCYPLWIYSANGDFIDNNFPKELESNMMIDKLLDEIQKEFDNLFIDNEIEFKYIGFKNTSSKELFNLKIKRVEKLILNTLGTAGVLLNNIDIEKL